MSLPAFACRKLSENMSYHLLSSYPYNEILLRLSGQQSFAQQAYFLPKAKVHQLEIRLCRIRCLKALIAHILWIREESHFLFGHDLNIFVIGYGAAMCSFSIFSCVSFTSPYSIVSLSFHLHLCKQKIIPTTPDKTQPLQKLHLQPSSPMLQQ